MGPAPLNQAQDVASFGSISALVAHIFKNVAATKPIEEVDMDGGDLKCPLAMQKVMTSLQTIVNGKGLVTIELDDGQKLTIDTTEKMRGDAAQLLKRLNNTEEHRIPVKRKEITNDFIRLIVMIAIGLRDIFFPSIDRETDRLSSRIFQETAFSLENDQITPNPIDGRDAETVAALGKLFMSEVSRTGTSTEQRIPLEQQEQVAKYFAEIIGSLHESGEKEIAKHLAYAVSTAFVKNNFSFSDQEYGSTPWRHSTACTMGTFLIHLPAELQKDIISAQRSEFGLSFLKWPIDNTDNQHPPLAQLMQLFNNLPNDLKKRLYTQREASTNDSLLNTMILRTGEGSKYGINFSIENLRDFYEAMKSSCGDDEVRTLLISLLPQLGVSSYELTDGTEGKTSNNCYYSPLQRSGGMDTATKEWIVKIFREELKINLEDQNGLFCLKQNGREDPIRWTIGRRFSDGNTAFTKREYSAAMKKLQESNKTEYDAEMARGQKLLVNPAEIMETYFPPNPEK
ncbi:MAG: hypothetical protein LBS68_00920 [Puniceicoccales bacterium]|jgi:hypothetical protein|nr:hypothetical protein [Puniceicoccales bacterium]